MVLASIRKISGKKKLKTLDIKTASPVPFSKIKTIGILYYIDSPEEEKNIAKILKHEFLADKEVEILCWLKSSKKKPHPAVDKVTFVERVDFDTKFLPSSKKSRYFCDKEFDLLLDLTPDYHFPMHAAAVMSNAKLKTGVYDKHNWHLQVKIKLSEAKKHQPVYLMDQVAEYLEKLF